MSSASSTSPTHTMIGTTVRELLTTVTDDIVLGIELARGSGNTSPMVAVIMRPTEEETEEDEQSGTSFSRTAMEAMLRIVYGSMWGHYFAQWRPVVMGEPRAFVLACEHVSPLLDINFYPGDVVNQPPTNGELWALIYPDVIPGVDDFTIVEMPCIARVSRELRQKYAERMQAQAQAQARGQKMN